MHPAGHRSRRAENRRRRTDSRTLHKTDRTAPPRPHRRSRRHNWTSENSGCPSRCGGKTIPHRRTRSAAVACPPGCEAARPTAPPDPPGGRTPSGSPRSPGNRRHRWNRTGRGGRYTPPRPAACPPAARKPTSIPPFRRPGYTRNGRACPAAPRWAGTGSPGGTAAICRTSSRPRSG